jgi:hypothetical protein
VRRRHLLAWLIASTPLICALLPSSAYPAQSASLHVSFTPYVPGQSTNVGFDVDINAPVGHTPPPLTELDLHYPSDLGLAVSGLGLATCAQQTLEAIGPEGCPADSRMGQGSAVAEIPTGPEIIQETASVTILRASDEQGRIAMLFDVDGETPVNAEVVFSGVLLPLPQSTRESIDIGVPLVEGLPGSPDVAVVQLDATFGPRGLIYYEHVHGKLVPYTPQGILLPNHCPHGGFHFSAFLSFLGGTSTIANTVVRCPVPTRAPRERASIP